MRQRIKNAGKETEMEIDLNELERLANAAHKYNNFWFEKDDFEDLNIGSDDAALIARMSHDVVLELVRRLRESEKDAERYRLLRRGQHWSTVDGIGDTLRGEALDRAIDAVMQPPRVGDCTEVKPF